MFRRIRGLAQGILGGRADADLREEMEAHRALRQEQLEREGLSVREAEFASRHALGNVTLAREDARDVWIVRWIETFRQDVRNGFRILIKHRGVTITALLSLALGIGANTAVFSLIDGMLLRPLPYQDPDRLVMIWAAAPGRSNNENRATAPEYLAWQKHATHFEVMGTERQEAHDLSGDKDTPAEVVFVQRLQTTLFEVLGVRPSLGRSFRPDEEQVGAPAPVVLLSDRFWERRFGRDPHVINKTLRLDGVPTTIVGVMPAGFAYLHEVPIDLFAPFAFTQAEVRGSGRAYAIAAKLRPGVTIAQAQAEMDAVAREVGGELPEPSRGWGARVQPLQEALFGDTRLALTLLQGVVGLVLLVACGNVAGLLLARSSSRHTEIAVRAAIGAARARIIRQLLTESLMLALTGGVLGIGVAWVLLKLLVVMTASSLPVVGNLPALALGSRVLLFTSAAALLTGVIFGTLPALRASRPDLVTALKASAKDMHESVGGQRMRSAVVVAQVAMAVMLLVGAGLFINSFVRLVVTDLGGDPRDVLTFTVPFQESRFFRPVDTYKGYPLIEVSPAIPQTVDRILERLRAIPGVQAVAAASFAPFTGGGPSVPFRIEGRGAPDTDDARQALSAACQLVTPGFFGALKVPIARGRDFDPRDSTSGPWVVVVNEAMATAFWPGANPLGQRLTLDLTPDEQPREVIGIVSNFRASPYERKVRPAMFVLHSQQPAHTRGPAGTAMRNRTNFVIRSAGHQEAVIPAIRSAMAGVDRDRPMTEVQPLEQAVATMVNPARYAMTILALFAGIATVLASVGLFGVISHAIGQRTHEIGIRMALGATGGDVLHLIMRRVVVLVGAGLIVGLITASIMLRLMASLISGVLVDVTPNDMTTYGLAAIFMAIVGLVAGLIPTRRATRVAPTDALRCE
jgi:putative ABC transport system permease protein